jgi:hypothetical protein
MQNTGVADLNVSLHSNINKVGSLESEQSRHADLDEVNQFEIARATRELKSRSTAAVVLQCRPFRHQELDYVREAASERVQHRSDLELQTTGAEVSTTDQICETNPKKQRNQEFANTSVTALTSTPASTRYWQIGR